MKLLHIFAAASLLLIGLVGCGDKKSAKSDTSATQAEANVKSQAGQKPYVVDFYATWCGPCKKLKPFFEQMEQRYGMQADFASVDVDEQPELANRLSIDVVPTVIVFQDNTMSKELARVQGFAPEELERAILDHI